MSYETALTAAYDQNVAEIRELVQLVRKHHQAGICNGKCPGLKVVATLAGKPHLTWLDLLLTALMVIEEMQSGPQSGPIAPELWQQTAVAVAEPKPAGRWAWILRRSR